MATRNLNSPPIFAKNAETAIPPEPSGDTAYRDTTLTQQEQQIGFLYNKIVGSSKLMNQYFFELTDFLAEIENSGILAWSPDADYPVDALVVASDDNIYMSKISNSNLNPLSNPQAWGSIGAIAAQDYILQDLSNASKTGAGNTIVTNDEPTINSPIVGTQPAGTSNDIAASTAFVQNAAGGGGSSNYKYYIHILKPVDIATSTLEPFGVLNISSLRVPQSSSSTVSVPVTGTIRYVGQLTAGVVSLCGVTDPLRVAACIVEVPV